MRSFPSCNLVLSIGLLYLAITMISCTTAESALADKKNYVEDNPEYRRKFEFTPDSNEKIERYGFHYVVSSLPGIYRVRVFHPDKKMMTEDKHYSTPALTLLHGEYKSWWDDGSIREQGFYQYGRKHGIWLEKEPGQGKSASGEYFNQRKEGMWTQLDTTGMIESVYIWKDGKRHGKFQLYDSEGTKINEGLYKNDTLISELFKQPLIIKPFLSGCMNDVIPEDVHTCTQNILNSFFYGELRYPPSARQNKITGSAIVQWDVMPDGDVENIRVPQSLSDDIKDAIMRVMEKIPSFEPAKRDGVPVKWTMWMPINFTL